MRKRTGGRVLLGITLLLPLFLFYLFGLFRLPLVPFPDTFFAMFGFSVATLDWRVAEYAADAGQYFVMLALLVGWARAILTYEASARSARWIRVSGASCFGLWILATVALFVV